MALITTLEAATLDTAKPSFVYATDTDDTDTIGTVMGTNQVMICIDNAVYKDRNELQNLLTRMNDYIMEQAKAAPKHAAA